ncbi:MAG TPA: N-acetylmuramoyl-L-alanine amidase [Sphingomonadaceae bacterium]|nr:N-acetylmuramoyl-L-alanine amidase [Sphingomonadaceae bacterium]
MSLRLQLLLLAIFPVALLAGLYWGGISIPVPHLGRGYVLRFELPQTGIEPDLPEILGPQDLTRPLVVIDPGHGGYDPGATGGGFQEKDIALGLALSLRDRLLEEGGIRVALTRDNDRFLVLEERADIARRLDADLFLSIHADSAGDRSGIGGATIYTLSRDASDAESALLAARENSADDINGVSLAGQSDEVSAILFDLSQRRAGGEAAEFAGLIEREGQGHIQFHPEVQRSANFVVLHSPDVPAVLFEAGFVTNPEDARRLASPEGRARFAEALERAIRVYFARNSGI